MSQMFKRLENPSKAAEYEEKREKLRAAIRLEFLMEIVQMIILYTGQSCFLMMECGMTTTLKQGIYKY